MKPINNEQDIENFDYEYFTMEDKLSDKQLFKFEKIRKDHS